MPNLLRAALLLACSALTMFGQAIEFESNGLRYQTLTRNGLTIMFTYLPMSLKDMVIVQVAISNGSGVSWTVKPEDFWYLRKDGSTVQPTPPRKVVARLLEKGGRNEAIRLMTTYEMSLYGLARVQSTNGYEQRRQQALAELSSPRLKAATAASVVSFVATKLNPRQTTDGAVFFPASERSLGPGKLMVRAAGEIFEFETAGPHEHNPTP
jgi:hypothetical protein